MQTFSENQIDQVNITEGSKCPYDKPDIKYKNARLERMKEVYPDLVVWPENDFPWVPIYRIATQEKEWLEVGSAMPIEGLGVLYREYAVRSNVPTVGPVFIPGAKVEPVSGSDGYYRLVKM